MASGQPCSLRWLSTLLVLHSLAHLLQVCACSHNTNHTDQLAIVTTVVDGLKYAKSHEWVKLDGDTATVGITDFAQVCVIPGQHTRGADLRSHTPQSELGDVVYVELPEVGTVVKKGETFGVIESVKVRGANAPRHAPSPPLQAATDLYSPMSGEVLETNSVLVDDPGQVNSAPYDSWIMKVKVSTPDEAGDLLQAGDYSEHCEAGGH